MVFCCGAWGLAAQGDAMDCPRPSCNAAVIGYCLSQGTASPDAAQVAPFEYLGLPLGRVSGGW